MASVFNPYSITSRFQLRTTASAKKLVYNTIMDPETEDKEKEDEGNRTNNQTNTSDSNNKDNSTGNYEESEEGDKEDVL